MTSETVITYWVKLYLSGPLDVIKQECRKECLTGLCVTVEPTLFIYTGGEETGAVIGLLNYPRFPRTPEEITSIAAKLALQLLEATHQHSVLIVTPDFTKWITKRCQEEQ